MRAPLLGLAKSIYYMNFVMDGALFRVSVAQWQGIGARNPKALMFDSSGRLRVFSLFHTSDNTTKTCFSISLPTPKLTISLIQYKFISTLRLFYLNNVFCYIDHSQNFPENSELMLKPLNSWMGLLEKHKHYRLPPTE